jgi:16S rRNA C967 or C1407 C5-methylase (RsmB/RsmF family)
MTKVGGLCVYSTCSINPIEVFIIWITSKDEAVVCELFRRLVDKDSIELLDVSERLKGIQF